MTRVLLTASVLLTCLGNLPAQKLLGARDPAALSSRIGTQVAWLTNDPQLLREGNRNPEARAALRKNKQQIKGFDRLAALAQARSKAAAEKRMILWYIPRIDGRQMYRPALLDLYMKAVLFSDPDCVSIINRRFIPLRLICDKQLQEATGITAPDKVEPALVFLKPDGTVIRMLDRIRTFNAWWFEDLLRGMLDQNPDLAPPGFDRDAASAAAKDAAGKLALARELLADGSLVEAGAALAKALSTGTAREQASAHYLMAQFYRRLGSSEQALDELTKAEQAFARVQQPKVSPGRRRGRRPTFQDDLTCERGRTLLFQKNLSAAYTAFQACRSGPRRPEALYHLGLVEWLLGSNARARRQWKLALHTSADDPYSWKAATNLVDGPDLTSLGPTLHGFEDVFAPRRPASAVSDTSAPVREENALDLARASLEVLLRLQRDDGGWTDGRYAYWSSPDLTPNVWVAVTATSCSALLEWRELDPKAVDEALERGEQYMFAENHMARGFNEEIYAEGYKLQYLIRKYDHARNQADRQAVNARMNHVVGDLKRLQTDQGFWAHEYPNPFCTASVLSALEQAKKRGARIPQRMLVLGAKALLTTRGKDGSFTYGAGRGKSTLKDAMGRAPISEAAVLGAGVKEGSLEKVTFALDNFWKYLPRFERIRKCDFHTDGELGGFFFWHATYHTAEAIEALPEGQRARHEQAMLAHVLKIGEFDGTFLDSHEFGKSYGTSMALLTLKKVLRVKHP